MKKCVPHVAERTVKKMELGGYAVTTVTGGSTLSALGSTPPRRSQSNTFVKTATGLLRCEKELNAQTSKQEDDAITGLTSLAAVACPRCLQNFLTAEGADREAEEEDEEEERAASRGSVYSAPSRTPPPRVEFSSSPSAPPV